jgi:hypothetical protein
VRESKIGGELKERKLEDLLKDLGRGTKKECNKILL